MLYSSLHSLSDALLLHMFLFSSSTVTLGANNKGLGQMFNQPRYLCLYAEGLFLLNGNFFPLPFIGVLSILFQGLSIIL